MTVSFEMNFEKNALHPMRSYFDKYFRNIGILHLIKYPKANFSGGHSVEFQDSSICRKYFLLKSIEQIGKNFEK